MANSTRTPLRRPVSSNSSAISTSPPRPKALPTSSAISKGATARSAASPRASPPIGGRARTTSAAGISPRSSPVPHGEVHANGREALVASLKRETDEKEGLLVRLQEKDAHIATLTSESTNTASSLHTAETRLAELYAEQSRMEEEMAARMEITEKLRAQVRDLEREKRETQRRYTEQTATFEAERQAFYDNEQHLKSRIQSLTATRKAQQDATERTSSPTPSVTASLAPSEARSPSPKTPIAHLPPQKLDDSDVSDGPEVTALKLELSTLSISHTSLQTMVQMLQTELADLKRVNNELQEENESFGLLLMERAMNGTGVDMLRQMGGDGPSALEETANSVDEKSLTEEGERSSLRSTGRSTLGRVSETEELALEGEGQQTSLVSELSDPGVDKPHLPRRRRIRQNSVSSSPHGTPHGESLADLPITGPGLDLAAELGRAETKDILGSNAPAASGSMDQVSPPRRNASSRKMSDAAGEPNREGGSGEIEVLRQEVKSLKDANKALSLYASKIIDRIIMQEGFEHVLSVDYIANDKTPAAPKSPGAFEEVIAKAKESSPAKPKPRPQSMLLGRATSLKTGASLSSKDGSFKFPSRGEPEKASMSSTPASPASDVKRSRRSMSFDWKSFSMFGGGSAALSEKERNLRPLTLRPGSSSTLTGARKLETHEDDDDKKERERLNATMKLMGIEKPANAASGLMVKSQSEPTGGPAPEAATSKQASTSRFSFFRSKSAVPATTATASSASFAPASLTSEALEQAEAETTLASLDAHEKVLTAEIAKGSSGGFTELHREGRLSLGDEWRSRRSRSVSGKSHESSGASTVWSAGMRADEE